MWPIWLVGSKVWWTANDNCIDALYRFSSCQPSSLIPTSSAFTVAIISWEWAEMAGILLWFYCDATCTTFLLHIFRHSCSLHLADKDLPSTHWPHLRFNNICFYFLHCLHILLHIVHIFNIRCWLCLNHLGLRWSLSSAVQSSSLPNLHCTVGWSHCVCIL